MPTYNQPVEVMLQHRDLPIDEVKRQCPGGWIAKLRSIAQFAVDNTPEDQFSSSKNVVFSRLMKDRAVNSILPSLFEVAQSYEDYVFQHSLWSYEDDELPLGQTITWSFIARPPKQVAQRRRIRTVRTARASRDESDVDARGDSSNSDTEVDEGMERLADRLSRQATAHAARNNVVTVQGRKVPVSKVSSPVSTATPLSHSGLPSSSDDSTPGSSFNSCVGHLQLDEDTKRGGFAGNQRGHQPNLNPALRSVSYPNLLPEPMQRAHLS